jgi:hypothetical protein
LAAQIESGLAFAPAGEIFINAWILLSAFAPCQAIPAPATNP